MLIYPSFDRRFHIHMSFRERRGAPPALQMDDEYTEDEDGKSGGCPYETNVLEMSCDIGDTTFRKGRLAITISFSTLSWTVHNVYDKAQRHQILTEIQTLYSVDTPWLVGFYGAYFKDQALSLILQYCDRGSLDGLVIQDIKPQNILVTSQGCVKLTDF
ncbi:hypothetical protein DYB30_000536, partial [Aphanomyces astaci]